MREGTTTADRGDVAELFTQETWDTRYVGVRTGSGAERPNSRLVEQATGCSRATPWTSEPARAPTPSGSPARAGA